MRWSERVWSNEEGVGENKGGVCEGMREMVKRYERKVMKD